ncbi:hypothetical protein OKA05_11420 [Luteolibacter arcticus]|uniref:PA14 domain-containing protein n=1 Tax=Luteolibacter arcticus TaxID=1581411 RepID=A0ABT3GI16_9BACT|nr:hypothetical protein [Luteolibacter arcticus]MCW1923164.1 hypothetical protein [Luteolibacter arcticus]
MKHVVRPAPASPPNGPIKGQLPPTPIGSSSKAGLKMPVTGPKQASVAAVPKPIARPKPAPAGDADHGKAKGVWRKLGGSALSISLLAHAVFILLAIFLFIRWIEPPQEKIDFIPGGGGGGSAGSEVSHKIQQKVRQQMTPTVLSKRIASTSLTAEFSLPDSSNELPDPSLPIEMAAASLGKGGGAGGGSGTGIGTGAGRGTGPGSGLGIGQGFMDPNPFGTTGGAGLVGTFYDFKRDQKNKDTGVKAPDEKDYTSIVRGFIKSSKWAPPSKHKHFTADTKLRSKAFTYQLMQDTEAAKAFQCPDSGPGMWVAHYTGRVKVTETGIFRFVGWGDNCMVIGFDSKVVFDSSFWHFTRSPRELVGNGVPGHPTLPIYSGEWIELRKGQSIKVDVLIGDAGGVFTVAAMIEKQGASFTRAPNGIPNLPIFLVADLEEKEKALYPFLSPESLNRTLFQADVNPMGEFGF